MAKRTLLGLLLLVLVALSVLLSWTQAPSVQSSPAGGRANAATLDSYVREFRFTELAALIPGLPASRDRDYFAGVLANREGRAAESIELLEGVLPKVKASSPERAAVALLSLADDYVKTYRYADAVRAYQDLLHNFASQLDKSEKQSTTDDYRTVLLLKDAPPQSITFAGSVDLPMHRNPVLDTLDVALTVGGVTESWILDTGANYSAVTASFARRLGAKLLPGEAQTQGITGAENKLRAAILPELKVGGATVHNVVLVVLEDSSFNVPAGKDKRYQINAVLGYPVLQALQRVTFASDGHFLAGPGSPGGDSGAPMFMNLLMPLLECRVEGRPVLFSFDSGANQSFFSVRYYREFASQFKGLTKKRHGMGGAGGVRFVDAYFLPHPQLGIGAATVTLKNVPVLPALGTYADKLFGNLGRDVTDPYSSFTIDFASMRFQLGNKLPAAGY